MRAVLRRDAPAKIFTVIFRVRHCRRYRHAAAKNQAEPPAVDGAARYWGALSEKMSAPAAGLCAAGAEFL